MLKITTAVIFISLLASCQMVKLREKRGTKKENSFSNNESTSNNKSELNVNSNIKNDKDAENENNNKLVFFKTKKDEGTNNEDKTVTSNKTIKNNQKDTPKEIDNKNSLKISNETVKDSNNPNDSKKISLKETPKKVTLKETPKSLKDYKIGSKVTKNKKADFNNDSIQVYNPKEIKKETYLKSNSIDMSRKIDVSKRAVTLRIDTMTNWIMPNDKIDIIAIFNNRSNKKMATTLVENILVLAVGDYTSENLAKSEKKKIYYNNITLSLSLKQAEVLILAQEQGKLYFVLRNDSNSNKESDGKKIIINNGR